MNGAVLRYIATGYYIGRPLSRPRRCLSRAEKSCRRQVRRNVARRGWFKVSRFGFSRQTWNLAKMVAELKRA